MIKTLTLRFALKVWQRNFDVWRKSLGVSLIGSLGEPVLYLLGMGFGLGSYLGTMDGTPYLQYIAPGLILSSGMYAATYECTYGAFLRMIHLKTYDAISSTPVSLEEVIAGDIFWGMTKCLISGSIMFLACLTFGLIHSGWAVGLFPLLLIGGFLFSSLAMWITSKAKTFEWFNYYLELFITPMFFFSGIFFPLDHFPKTVQTFARVFPLTHLVRSARDLIQGKIHPGILFTFFFILSISLALFFIAIRGVAKRLIK
ncbi:MAG: ABC transporter permease [Chlamydiae bacterium]|nr:ABC transporter permease [Chlamydiota bacterium]MBI3266436.1 ABC transporter permease [Chlamydiota bacterium]